MKGVLKNTPFFWEKPMGSNYSDYFKNVRSYKKHITDVSFPSFTIQNILEKKDLVYTNKQIIDAYCGSLKELLKVDDLIILISKIDQLDQDSQEVIDLFMTVEDLDFPRMKKFYERLSPVLLRAFQEGLKDGLDQKMQELNFREGIRVSVEEELHYWLEKSSI